MTAPPPPWGLEGRAVLVTGGGRGIGRTIATRFLGAGADVVVCGRTEPAVLPEAGGRTATFVAADVREADRAAAAVRAAADALGGLDVLVNNAGGAPAAPAATMSPRFFDRVLALNLHGAFYTAQAAHAVLRERGGSIVNIGTISAHDPSPGTAAYSVAKAGLLMLTRALALEWAPAVRVNHVTVGQVATPGMVDWYASDAEPGEAVLARLDRTVPAGRMASPDDVAAACLYLASPLAGYVSGADLAVTGGGEFPARFLATLPPA
ncbi:SDR family oxidoreductase [Pseudonocardia humida]|uniref:SDR family oxidoreductase n=1 Tax=Pseudonocardia humida TaxID=2800819 RepID=A0ABT0ZXX1_9PSEU|nr:SDR family oxidoreductase [Pseudonocardia humida]MCO1655499.1 SDR family oxidoreductase [Pseudonocardia humida]